ncbi:MAG: hypothetical protein U0176_04200 [Bacteroidia bacterium]
MTPTRPYNILWVALLWAATLFASCGSDQPAKPEPQPGTPTVKQRPDPKDITEQIPAAEILGATVKRNLRYQQEAETRQYISTDTLLEYIRRMNLSFRREVGKIPQEGPTTGTVVVGLNASGETHLWYIFPDGQPSAALKAASEKAVAAVPKPKVEKRLIVFGMACTFWGYQEDDREENTVTLPKEWDEITKRQGPQDATKLAEMTWTNS